jgi:hypothetical protein
VRIVGGGCAVGEETLGAKFAIGARLSRFLWYFCGDAHHATTQGLQRPVCLGPGTAGVRYQFFKAWHCSVARAARTRLTTLKAAAKTFVKIWRRPMKKSG